MSKQFVVVMAFAVFFSGCFVVAVKQSQPTAGFLDQLDQSVEVYSDSKIPSPFFDDEDGGAVVEAEKILLPPSSPVIINNYNYIVVPESPVPAKAQKRPSGRRTSKTKCPAGCVPETP